MDVRAMRQRAKLSQRELAGATGIAQPNISAYESGRLTPSTATLARIEEATRVRPSVLLARMRAQVTAVAARHHASNLRVFGSVATGSDTSSSDLDLLVHFSDTASLYDQIGLTQELEALLGVSVDVISDGAVGVERIEHAVAV
ncbi:XRE family transcriptional regulator [Leekyejoonella antrihumi]|nr:XRE family transcriptional regulator [Leekyejoonella antrihumi]